MNFKQIANEIFAITAFSAMSDYKYEDAMRIAVDKTALELYNSGAPIIVIGMLIDDAKRTVISKIKGFDMYGRV